MRGGTRVLGEGVCDRHDVVVDHNHDYLRTARCACHARACLGLQVLEKLANRLPLAAPAVVRLEGPRAEFERHQLLGQ